jgi:hypothetical protein
MLRKVEVFFQLNTRHRSATIPELKSGPLSAQGMHTFAVYEIVVEVPAIFGVY